MKRLQSKCSIRASSDAARTGQIKSLARDLLYERTSAMIISLWCIYIIERPLPLAQQFIIIITTGHVTYFSLRVLALEVWYNSITVAVILP